MFTRVTVVSVAATVVFVAADANPAFLGARRLCTRENAIFVRKPEVPAEASDFFPCSVKRPSHTRSLP